MSTSDAIFTVGLILSVFPIYVGVAVILESCTSFVPTPMSDGSWSTEHGYCERYRTQDLVMGSILVVLGTMPLTFVVLFRFLEWKSGIKYQ